MLNEEKIRLMTKISIYEKNEEYGDLVLARYYREDFVRLGCIKAILVATLTYWLIVAAYAFYQFEELLAEINNMDYFSVIGKLMLGYIGFLLIIFVFAFLIYNVRYQFAKKGLIRYNRNLKRLITMEEREEVVNKYHDRIRVSTSIGGDSPELDEIINGKKPTE
ncbi:MAG: hypothetical protein K5897_09395 [Eubacterium sp.]|nr:hypothetical protein [Eubacterium sp.]